MSKFKLFFAAMIMLLTAGLASAQNITVKGVVSDEAGVPIIGATVMVPGTTNGTSTGVDGDYTVTVPSNAKLQFSMVGYETVEVNVAGRKQINVVLKEDSEFLEDAIVVGYGSSKKVGTVVGSVTTVKADIVRNAPSSSALDQLSGQVAGLAVLTTSGVAGSNNVSMTLHGVGSLGASSTPLYIIDGVPSSSGSIMAMNPNDILSISILKDASATSIYGSRAANGVVFVTTRQGNYDSRSRVTIRSQYGISTLANTAIYGNMMSSAELKDFWVRSGIHDQAYIDATYNSKGYNADTQWYKVMQQLNNPQYQNDVTVEGGGSKVAYMISASQFHQRGTSVGNYYDRYTVRSNVQGHHKEWLKTGINASFSLEENQQNGYWGSTGNSNYTSGGLSYLLIPMYPTIDPETGDLYKVRFPNGTTNPYYYMESYPRVQKYYNLMGSAYVEIEPIRNLVLRSQVGTDMSFALNTSSNRPSSELVSTGSRSKSGSIGGTNTITNTIEYSFDIANDHKFSALLGHEGTYYKSESVSASSSGQDDDRLLTLGGGKQETYSVGEGLSEYKFLSFFGHLDYNYKSRYNLDFTLRDDASSRFGVNNRHAMFWSVGALWNAKKENFLKGISQINDLRLKVSYGTQGNAGIGNYDALARLSTGTYADSPTLYLSNPGNPNLTWETQGLFTVALNGRFFNMVDLGLEVYNRETRSMLMSVPYPYTSGFSSATSNVGALANTGVDITLGIDILKSRDYYLRFNTTFNYNKMNVKELFQGRERWEIANTGVAYVVGKPVMFYYPIFAGIDPADGAPTWYVPGENKDITTMDPNNITKKFDEESLTQNTGAQRYAPINGGFNFQGGWKNFSFSADFSYTLGKYLVNNDMYFYANPYNFSTMNTYKGVSDFWTPEHTNTQWPAWGDGHIMQFDTHLLENASFLRLKSLQVAYKLPDSLFGNKKVFEGMRITFTGRNLLTFTNFTGVDPEVNSNLTYGKNGNSKQYLLGLELSF